MADREPLAPLCFVLMPFGKKMDPAGRVTNFDSVYAKIIAPAVERAGLEPVDSLDEPDAPPVASPVPLLGAVSRIDLERAIEALPPACRAAFLLHDVEGFGHQEVGAMLGISEGTSKSQVHKARMRIRSYLAHGTGKVES